MPLHHREHLRRRSQLQGRLCADVAVVNPTRSTSGVAAHGDLPWRQRHARFAAVLAQHLPHRSSRTLVPLVQRALSIKLQAVIPRGNRARSSCAAGCAVASPRRCSIPFQSPLTMTRRWAARATSSPAARRRRPPAGKARIQDQDRVRAQVRTRAGVQQRPPPRKVQRRHQPSRRTGSTCMPSARSLPSINVNCSTCRPNTPVEKA